MIEYSFKNARLQNMKTSSTQLKKRYNLYSISSFILATFVEHFHKISCTQYYLADVSTNSLYLQQIWFFGYDMSCLQYKTVLNIAVIPL